MLKSIAYRLQVLLIILGYGNMGLWGVRLQRDTVGTITRQSVSMHAASDNTLAGQT
jgi:hypothetical protein